MNTQASTKVRLVRCPKCRQVLAELPGVPLYKCGGCGTVLQAKNRRLEPSSTESSAQETDSVAKGQHDDALEASSSNKDFTSRPEVESLSDKDKTRCEDENNGSVELCEDASVLSSSPEVACPRNEDSSIEANDFSKHDSLGLISRRYHSNFRDDMGELSRARNFSDGLFSSNDQMEGRESQMVWQKGDNFVAKILNLPDHEYTESVLLPEGEKDNHISPENDDKSRVCSADQNGDFQGEIKPSGIVSYENESTEKNMNINLCDSNVASRSPSKESLASFYLASPDDENTDHFPSEATRNFGGRRSLDTFGSSVPPVTNYSKIESSYSYDGSESSYDGTDDQIRERISQPSRKNNNVNIGTTEMLRKKNGCRGDNMANSEPEWDPTSSPHSATMKNNHWSQSIGNRYASGNRTRLDEQEGVSRIPGPSPPSYRHGSLPPHPVFKPSYPEPDRIDLLRTVCELQDQLSRMHFPQVRRYNHFSPAREIYSDARRRHNYNLRHNQVNVCAEQLPPHYMPQISCSCLHCCPSQDWRYTAHLPPHNSMHRKNSPRGVHSEHCCNNYSNSSSPQRYTSSEASLQDYEAKPYDEVKQARLKEKYFTAKKHIRPVAGGAPVVVCYHCSELLRLPADFLLFRKKYHRLLCNACKKVLRFSVRKGTHLIPYVPGASAPPPPPSEADQYSDAINMKPLSHSSSFRRVEPLSCSDDSGYGRSFGRSCSTEGECCNEKMPSGSSYEAVEDEKMKYILTEPRDEDASLMRGVEYVGPSSEMPKSRKVNSETGAAMSSPLHRLMGYSSPSQVLDECLKDENVVVGRGLESSSDFMMSL